MYDVNIIVEDLREIAVLAGNLLVEQTIHMSVTQKTSHKDLVTNMDVFIENMIISRIKSKYSNACFISEEKNYVHDDLSSELTFVIDPIDGTSNFVKSVNHSSVSIGCFINGVPVAGVVFNPFVNEMFYAAVGNGAYLNDKPIKVTDSSIFDSLVAFGTSPYDVETTEETFDKVSRVYNRCLDIRRFGAASLDICSVACARIGLYFESRLSLWDYAAAAVILNEAGGVICDFSGNPLSFSIEKTSVIAGSRRTIEESGLLGAK